MKPLSLYWKCQLIGWSACVVIVSLLDYLIYSPVSSNEFLNFIPFAISLFILGLGSTHLMRIVIKKTRILQKGFIRQLISLSVLTLLFSAIGTLIWMIIMVKAGYWEIEGDTRKEWINDFIFNEFSFNLFPVFLVLAAWTVIYVFRSFSLYWKCQLIGWSICVVMISILDYIIYSPDHPDEFFNFIPFAISILIFGPALTHLMKIIIQKNDILQKRFVVQVIRLIGLSLFFSITGTLIWMAIMVKAGYWEIEGNTRKEWINDFIFNEFSFNLFPVFLVLSGWLLIYFLYHYIRKDERLRMQYKIDMVALEAKALRSQMNPHFIFNCLNSIKLLIQDDQKEKSVTYLTTFSKLIRTLFNNADKKEISLYDEIETCKLYLQLEAMRFDAKFSYTVNIDETLDLKSISVPALIIQPFIENSIWHGIVPKGKEGHIELSVEKRNGSVEISIDDNGIGRQASEQNKSDRGITHQSKGVNITQSRLELDNLLRQRNAKLETIDKKDQHGVAIGTKVIITINEEQS